MDSLKILADLYGQDLAEEQLRLEAEAYALGEKRFLEAMENKEKAGEGADTSVARPLVATMIPQVVEQIEAEYARSASQGAGRRASALKYMKSVATERMAYIAVRELIQSCMARKTSLQDITMRIGLEVETEARFGRLRDNDVKLFQKNIRPNIAKRASHHFKHAYARAVESALQASAELPSWDGWGTANNFAVGLKLVECILNTGLAVLESEFPGNPKLHKRYVRLSEEVVSWLSDRKATLAGFQPIHAPMVVPPKPWVSVSSGGYWSAAHSPLKFLKGMSRKARRRYKEVDLSQVFDAVNAIQNTPWVVNRKVLDVAKEVSGWKNPVADLPSPERMVPEAVTEEEASTPETLKMWKRKAAGVYRMERARQSRRYSMEFTLEQAEKYSRYERIWFPYNVDFRSRVYAIPSFCPQGTDLTKGLLLLADPVPVGEDGAYWMKIHLANTFGLDKEPLDVRVKWAEENDDLIQRVAADPLDYVETWSNADSPFCFLAACMEWASYKAIGPSYRSGLPIAFDGSCSGIQHFSCMLQDHIGGAAVNLVPGDRPSDIYRIVAESVKAEALRLLVSGTDTTVTAEPDETTGEIVEVRTVGTKVLAKQWLDYGITRKVTKRSVMTLPYGSKQFGFTDQLLEDIIGPAIQKHGPDVFPNPRDAASFMAKLIWDALQTTVVAAVGAMSWLQKAASALTSQQMPAHWVTPIGFPVWQEYRIPTTKRIDTVICGDIRVAMKVALTGSQEDTGKNLLDRHKQVNAISPNFVHSMDAAHLMLTAIRARDQGVGHFAMIHDSFGTCPGNAGVMFRVVRETMVEIYSTRDVIREFYETFCDSLTEDALEKIPELPPKGHLDLNGILDSKYCFA